MEGRTQGSNKFDWQRILDEVQAEPDPKKLREKVGDAEMVIFQRLQSIAQAADSSEERSALKDAAETLLALKRHVLNYPDWGSDTSSRAQ